jgi:adenine-specific DNA-methyltransferase
MKKPNIQLEATIRPAPHPSQREGGSRGYNGKVRSVNGKVFYSAVLYGRVKELRKNATPAERKMWAALRELNKTHEIKFRRQHPFAHFITDFYCHAEKLVIEIDGASHDSKYVADQQRNAFMREQGLHVLRFTEVDVIRDVSAAAETILAYLKRKQL